MSGTMASLRDSKLPALREFSTYDLEGRAVEQNGRSEREYLDSLILPSGHSPWCQRGEVGPTG